MHWGFLFIWIIGAWLVWALLQDNRICFGSAQLSDEAFEEMPFRGIGIMAYRNFCGALDWFSLSVGGVGVSRGGVEFVPVDAGPVCGRDAVVRFGRRCLFALPQGVGDE